MLGRDANPPDRARYASLTKRERIRTRLLPRRGPVGARMKPERTADDPELSSIPTDFRENYRFLSKLIECREKNDSFRTGLKALIERNPPHVGARLNQRQIRLVRGFLKALRQRSVDCFSPPVPAELEASIRIRDRSTWLPRIFPNPRIPL